MDQSQKEQLIKKILAANEKLKIKTAKAYINASHNDREKIGGYGIVFIAPDGSREEIREKITQPEMLKGFNISVKMAAAIKVMNLCIKHHVERVELYHDLPILESLTRENSKPNDVMTKKYKENYLNLKNKLHITFINQKEINDDMNIELAKNLAKIAAGLKL